MKSFVVIVTVLFVSISYGQSYDAKCIARTVEGTFYAEVKGIDDYVVIRKKKKQIETCTFNGELATMVLKVDWMSATNYRITPIKYKNFPKNYPVDYEPIDVTIIGCNDEFFTTQVKVGERIIEGKYFFNEE